MQETDIEEILRKTNQFSIKNAIDQLAAESGTPEYLLRVARYICSHVMLNPDTSEACADICIGLRDQYPEFEAEPGGRTKRITFKGILLDAIQLKFESVVSDAVAEPLLAGAPGILQFIGHLFVRGMVTGKLAICIFYAVFTDAGMNGIIPHDSRVEGCCRFLRCIGRELQHRPQLVSDQKAVYARLSGVRTKMHEACQSESLISMIDDLWEFRDAGWPEPKLIMQCVQAERNIKAINFSGNECACFEGKLADMSEHELRDALVLHTGIHASRLQIVTEQEGKCKGRNVKGKDLLCSHAEKQGH